MYIGIYENCFCLKYWKQSLLSVSLARFFFFNDSYTFVYYMAKKVLEASSMHFSEV